MHSAIQAAINFVFDGHDVPEPICQQAVAAIMDGECDEVSIAAFLTALRAKGEAVDEIVGAARAMSDRAILQGSGSVRGGAGSSKKCPLAM